MVTTLQPNLSGVQVHQQEALQTLCCTTVIEGQSMYVQLLRCAHAGCGSCPLSYRAAHMPCCGAGALLQQGLLEVVVQLLTQDPCL